MNDIRDLKITGIDSDRPPVVRKEPYIDLVFKLSDKAGREWCRDFNLLFERADYSVRIDIDEGLYIETWTRTMDEIPGHLEMLKAKVKECNQRCHERLLATAQAAKDKNSALAGEQGAQGRLNAIIAKLDFDD